MRKLTDFVNYSIKSENHLNIRILRWQAVQARALVCVDARWWYFLRWRYAGKDGILAFDLALTSASMSFEHQGGIVKEEQPCRPPGRLYADLSPVWLMHDLV